MLNPFMEARARAHNTLPHSALLYPSTQANKIQVLYNSHRTRRAVPRVAGSYYAPASRVQNRYFVWLLIALPQVRAGRQVVTPLPPINGGCSPKDVCGRTTRAHTGARQSRGSTGKNPLPPSRLGNLCVAQVRPLRARFARPLTASPCAKHRYKKMVRT